MIQYNLLPILASSLIPLLVGAIYYNPKVLGNAWMNACGFNEEYLKQANMLKIFGYTLLLSILLAGFIMPVVFHALHVFSLVGGQPAPDSAEMRDAAAFYASYGGNFLTFKHGAFHGIMAALFGVWPVLGISALFERRSWKYIAIHVGYWAIVFALMGGIICAFGVK
jgi:hypothetical protein